MKLFVWHGEGVLVDYSSGQITAIAPDLETALALIREECVSMSEFPYDRPTDVIDLGNQVAVEPRVWITWGCG